VPDLSTIVFLYSSGKYQSSKTVIRRELVGLINNFFTFPLDEKKKHDLGWVMTSIYPFIDPDKLKEEQFPLAVVSLGYELSSDGKCVGYSGLLFLVGFKQENNELKISYVSNSQLRSVGDNL
jgi:hypothetical protein